jgi:GT2 family glycosyltransferase
MAAIPMDEPFKVHAVGGACFLVHRDVFVKVADMAKGITAYPWWEEVYQPKMDAQMGEDLAFCQRIRKAGFDIWYEPRAPFLHLRKPSFLGLEEYAHSLEVLLEHGDVYATDAE